MTRRFVSYNVLDLFYKDDDGPRWDRVAETIASLDADVVALQEIRVSPYDLLKRMEWLGDATGLDCWVRPQVFSGDGGDVGEVAVELGGHGFGVALLWNPDRAELVPSTVRRLGGDELWHGLIAAAFDVDDDEGGQERVGHASYHGPPFEKYRRADEAERVLAFATRQAPGKAPLLIGADWNTVGADRTRDGRLYDPDPYASQPWVDDFVYQCSWSYDEHGRRTGWRAYREPADNLYAGGLLDAAAVLDTMLEDGLPWAPTSGHWPTCPFPPRRIDAVRVTRDAAPALRSLTVLDTRETRAASDHLPLLLEYDAAALRRPAAS